MSASSTELLWTGRARPEDKDQGGEPARVERRANGLAVSGDWVRAHVRSALMDEAFSAEGFDSQTGNGKQTLSIDASQLGALDTLGCLALADLRDGLAKAGHQVSFINLPDDKLDLFDAVLAQAGSEAPKTRGFALDDLVAMFGRGVSALWSDLLNVTGMLGLVLTSIAWTLMRPTRWRFNAFITQLDKSALRAVPIIILIQFVIGGIIAQQGVYQLRLFGAEIFAIDLVAILVLREIGVLISAIMVAGRTGSAFTAEIGAMRMREEVDAMRVIGLDPVDVLVIPRVVGLVFALPLLTVIANAAALAGGMLVVWIYSGIDPVVFIDRMHNAILLETVMVGLIKAPFMAMAIGCIACVEGFRVQGSTESLGQRVTASVVKSIFVVIVMDGVFAMFFASIDY
ncbi:MAG: ABC transporter permease [Pseudomonadota bacterium]